MDKINPQKVKYENIPFDWHTIMLSLSLSGIRVMNPI